MRRSARTRRRRPTPRARRRDPREPRLRQHFTDHMVAVEWTAGRGLARRAGHAVRPAHARPGDRGPALRAGDLRGHEGLPARRRLGLDLPPRGERRADGRARPAGSRCPSCRPTDFLGSLDALVEVDQRWVPGRGRARRASTCGRSCSPPRRSSACGPAQQVTYMVIASPGRRLLRRRRQAGHALALRGVHPRRPRRHGRGQDAAATTPRRWSPSRRPPSTAATRSSSSTPSSGPVRRGARRHEPLLRHARRHASSPPSSPAPILEGITRARSSSSPRSSATRSRSAGSPSTSGATASPPARSPRSSPAAPPPSSPRSAGSRGTAARPSIGDDAVGAVTSRDPRRAGRHPVRPRRGHPRLAAPPGLGSADPGVASVGVHRPSGVGEPPRRQHEAGGSAQMADGVVARHDPVRLSSRDVLDCGYRHDDYSLARRALLVAQTSLPGGSFSLADTPRAASGGAGRMTTRTRDDTELTRTEP